MKSYLFLIAWFDGSESSGEKTKVHKQEDLYKQFKKGNEHVFAVVINLPKANSNRLFEEHDETMAQAFGYKAAFHANYTGHDSTSDIIKVNRHVQKVIDRITPEMLKTIDVVM